MANILVNSLNFPNDTNVYLTGKVRTVNGVAPNSNGELTVDSAPTSGSDNLVSSDGIYSVTHQNAENIATNTSDITSLKSAISTLNGSPENVLDLTALTNGWINSDGTIDTTDTSCKVTPFLPVNGTSITHSAFIESAYETQTKYLRQIAFYDENKTFLSRDSSNAVTYSVPDGAVYAIANFSNSYLYDYSMLSWTDTKLDKWTPYHGLPESYYSAVRGKSIVCLGDSICKGENWSSDDTIYPNSNTGWAKILHDDYACQVYGFGISGATVRKITDNTNSVYEQFATFVYQATSHSYVPDYLLIEGGINDATRYYNETDTDTELGALVDGFGQSNDYTTTVGALERMFYTAKVTFPETKIIYILPHHCSGNGFQTALQTYITAIKSACDKWSIPYIDLYTRGRLNGCIDALRSTYFDEYGVHPNQDGYEVMTGDIIEGMLIV